MPLSAIVPVWNGRDLLVRLLDSLAAQTLPAAEVLVVDNGSEDGAPEAARQTGRARDRHGPQRRLRRSRQPRHSGKPRRMAGSAEQRRRIGARTTWQSCSPPPQAGGAWFATGKILAAGSHDQIDGTFDAMCRGATSWRVGSGRSDRAAFSAERQIWSPPFTAVLLRAEVFRRAGLLETSFESYLEDVDFGLRCAALELAGVYVPGALAWHQGSATLGRWHPETVRRIARNQLFLVARHYPRDCSGAGSAARGGADSLGGLAVVTEPPSAGSAECSRGCAISARRENPAGLSMPRRWTHLLRANERLIRDLQTSTGFDSYWKLYFLLTGGGAK